MYMYMLLHTCTCTYSIHVHIMNRLYISTDIHCIYICSTQSRNLCNLQIALRKLKIHRMRANLQIGTHSADSAIIIMQTVEPQIPP